MSAVDVLVIGGGPVGLATALYAVRSGLSTLVLDPRDCPIDKACGEGLMPGGLKALHDLGIEPPGHGFKGIRYVASGAHVTADFADGPGRGVRRTTLHSALAHEVARAGVEVSTLTATGLVQGGRAVHVETSGPRGAAGPGSGSGP